MSEETINTVKIKRVMAVNITITPGSSACGAMMRIRIIGNATAVLRA
jgi:hypothetical protein